MNKVSLGGLPLLLGWHAHDPQATQMRVAFPLYGSTGTQSAAVVYFELDPGQRLETHSDSAEEILYVVEGTVEATVGDEAGQAAAGDLVLIPAEVPHGVRNVGTTSARCLGFFASPQITSTFAYPIEPLGTQVGGTPPVPPQAVPLTWQQIHGNLLQALGPRHP